MLILLSPAKSLDFTHNSPVESGTLPYFSKESQSIAKELKKHQPEKLLELMRISAKLAEINHTRNKVWNHHFKKQSTDKNNQLNFKQALYAYNGAVYQPLHTETYTKKDYNYIEKNIRIISGLYGLLTPLTYIKPYRLEMSTKLPLTHNKIIYKNLYEFWSNKLENYIKNEFTTKTTIINLASVEYSKAVNLDNFGNRVFHIFFKTIKKDTLVTIGTIAKHQRGAMTNWLIKNNIKTLEKLKEYKNNGFTYSKKHSTEQNIVFISK